MLTAAFIPASYFQKLNDWRSRKHILEVKSEDTQQAIGSCKREVLATVFVE